MSLIEQIRAIDAMIQYIEKVLPHEIDMLNDEAVSVAGYFRQNGRTDLADRGVLPRISSIKIKLDKLEANLKSRNLDYLYRVREDLDRALNQG